LKSRFLDNAIVYNPRRRTVCMLELYLEPVLRATIALFVIIDPIGNVPIFMSLTQGMNRDERRQVVKVASVTGFILLAAFALFGVQFLTLFNISMHSFKVAGGALLLLISLRILIEGGWRADVHAGESGAVPLGFPLLVGPGAITTTMVTLQSWGLLVTLTAVVAVSLITVLCLVLAEDIYRLLGRVGSNVVARVMAVFIAAIAVEFMMEGISQYLASSMP
jgi:multiple antibiotic resistance protein